jgi:hypothetical protein
MPQQANHDHKVTRFCDPAHTTKVGHGAGERRAGQSHKSSPLLTPNRAWDGTIDLNIGRGATLK